MKIKEEKIGGNVKSESKENKTESRLWQKWIKSGRSIVLPLGQQKNHRTPTMKRVEEKWVGKVSSMVEENLLKARKKLG